MNEVMSDLEREVLKLRKENEQLKEKLKAYEKATEIVSTNLEFAKKKLDNMESLLLQQI